MFEIGYIITKDNVKSNIFKAAVFVIDYLTTSDLENASASSQLQGQASSDPFEVKSNIFKAEMIEASYMINLWFLKKKLQLIPIKVKVKSHIFKTKMFEIGKVKVKSHIFKT